MRDVRELIARRLVERATVERAVKQAEDESVPAAITLLLRPPGSAGPRGTTAGTNPDPADPFATGGDLVAHEVLFIVRALATEDPWSGHIAFPGGRRDAHDDDLRRTALRELREETGIVLDPGDLLGELDPIHPRSRHLPSILVTPFVGWLSEAADVVGNVEITDHFWVSIGSLLAPERRSILRRRRGRALRVFPTIEHEGHTIWGLTYAILRDFLDRVRAADPDDGRRRPG